MESRRRAYGAVGFYLKAYAVVIRVFADAHIVYKIIDFPKAKSVKNIVCFSKPVPMEYVARRFPDITFITFDNLTNIQSRKL